MTDMLASVLIIVFFASTIRSAFGFGESLIAVPLLAFFIPLEEAVPLSVLLSITIAFLAVITDFKYIQIQSAKNLVLSTCVGIPLGILLLKLGSDSIVKMILGVSITLFSLFLICYRYSYEISNSKRYIFFFGFLAGILGGAYGMNGPPLVVYGSLRKWSAQHFRATLHAYFFPASLLGMVGYYQLGLLNENVSTYYIYSLPVLIPAVYIGRLLSQKLPEKIFKKLIYWLLLAIGGYLIYEVTSK